MTLSTSLLVLAALLPQDDAKLKAQFYHAFTDLKKPPGFELYGPNVAQCVAFEPAGLRIKLPVGYPSVRQDTGLLVPVAVTGNFQITVDFEILQEPEAADSGSQTRFSLVLPTKTATHNMAAFTRGVSRKGPEFSAWLTVSNKDTGANDERFKVQPTGARTGQLRVTRHGSHLSYYASTDGDKTFTLLQTFRFVSDDLKDVRIVAATGGPKAALDVRIAAIRIAAEALQQEAYTPKGEQRYDHTFTEKSESLFELYGADPEHCVKFEPAGLRITLPAGKAAEGPDTGVIAHVGVQGDFEITMDYEILKEPAPSTKQTRLTLGIAPSREGGSFASISKSVWPGTGGRWFTYLRADKPRGDTHPTTAAKGRLRLVRAGSYLLYYAAEGDGEFTLLQIYSFGTEDVSDVRISGSTGVPEATLDARVSHLHIRAQGLTNVPATAEQAAQTPEPRRIWWLLVLAAVVVVGGGFVALRRLFYRKSDSGATTAQRPRAVVQVTCPGCQKRLSLALHLAGKKIKCAACATTFVASQ